MRKARSNDRATRGAELSGRSGPNASSASSAAWDQALTEGAEGFPVGDVDQDASDPDDDLALLGSGERGQDPDGDVRGCPAARTCEATSKRLSKVTGPFLLRALVGAVAVFGMSRPSGHEKGPDRMVEA